MEDSADMSKLVKGINEIEDFKNQVMKKFEALIMKTPRPYSCFGCSMGFICLDGKPVAGCPLDKAMVTAKSDLKSGGVRVLVHAGDTGIGYYAPIGKVSQYTIIWENAGIQSYNDYSNMVYKCGANRQ